MSHIVTIPTQVRDPQAVAAACRRLDLPEPVHGTARLFSGEAIGLLVRLPDWLYPVVLDTATGQVHYDNFEGHWGEPQRLDALLQAYAVEKTVLEAGKRGYPVTEQKLPGGEVMIEITETS